MSNKKQKDYFEGIRITSIDDEVALKLLCRLAGSTKEFAEMSGVPYYKISNILQGKSNIKQEMLLSFYRESLTEEFRAVLEDAYLLLTALAETGVIQAGTPLFEMDDFEAKVFDLSHDAPAPAPPAPAPPAPPAPQDAQKFGFRSKKPVDKSASRGYSSPIIDSLFDDGEVLSESTASTASPMTGDILANVKTGGTVHETAIGDVFETGLRRLPDRFDSDNKRF